MLQCTPTAAATLDEVRQRNDLPEDVGVRLSAVQAPDGEVGLNITFTDTPVEGDHVTHQHGTTLIVAPEISDELSGMILDVVPDPSANGSASPQLVLRPNDAN
jgi:Fe-S cluster assembly iron-binding protein IscA